MLVTYSFIGWCICRWEERLKNNDDAITSEEAFNTDEPLQTMVRIIKSRQRLSIKQSGKTKNPKCGAGEFIHPIPTKSTGQDKFNRLCLRKRYDIF